MKKNRYFVDKDRSRLAMFEDDGKLGPVQVTIHRTDSMSVDVVRVEKYGLRQPLGTIWEELDYSEYCHIASKSCKKIDEAALVRKSMEEALEKYRKEKYEALAIPLVGVSGGLGGGVYSSVSGGAGGDAECVSIGSLIGVPGMSYWVPDVGKPEIADDKKPKTLAEAYKEWAEAKEPPIPAPEPVKDSNPYSGVIKSLSRVIETLKDDNKHLREMIETVRSEYLDTKNLLEISEEKLRKLAEKKNEGSQLRSA